MDNIYMMRELTNDQKIIIGLREELNGEKARADAAEAQIGDCKKILVRALDDKESVIEKLRLEKQRADAAEAKLHEASVEMGKLFSRAKDAEAKLAAAMRVVEAARVWRFLLHSMIEDETKLVEAVDEWEASQ